LDSLTTTLAQKSFNSFKGTVHPKMIHPHVISNLFDFPQWNTNEDILKNVSKVSVNPIVIGVKNKF